MVAEQGPLTDPRARGLESETDRDEDVCVCVVLLFHCVSAPPIHTDDLFVTMFTLCSRTVVD